MVNLIIGLKGSGKTNKLIEQVNDKVSSTDGAVVCIEKGTRLRGQINIRARLIDAAEFVDGDDFFGFVAGIVASNHDVKDIFIDSAIKMFDKDILRFTPFVLQLDKFAKEHDINFVITSSIAQENLPTELKKFV